MSDIKNLTEKVVAFRDARDWKQFHRPKDMAISLALEAAEVLEHFQWKNDMETADHLDRRKEDVADELADVLFWVLLMSHDFNIDIADAFVQKLRKTEMKYPVEKARGTHAKYTEL